MERGVGMAPQQYTKDIVPACCSSKFWVNADYYFYYFYRYKWYIVYVSQVVLYDKPIYCILSVLQNCLKYQSSKAPKIYIEKLDNWHQLICRKMSVLKTVLSVGSQISLVWVISLILYYMSTKKTYHISRKYSTSTKLHKIDDIYQKYRFQNTRDIV